MEWIIPSALSLLSIILLIIMLVSQQKLKEKTRENEKKTDMLAQVMNSEFERLRADTSRAIGEVEENTEKLRIENAERSAKLETALVKAFNEVKVNDMEQSEKQSRVIYSAVEKMRESNEQKLEQMRLTVDEKLASTLTTRIDSSFKTVSDRLESVNKSLGEMKELSNGVTANVSALNRVLTNVKARGTWAEVQLGSILDQTVPGMYETNFAPFENADDRVEFAIKIPSGDGRIAYLPVDSKFPVEDYIRVTNAADSADVTALENARKVLAQRVYSEAKKVSKYINVPHTTPYAVLYLATEGLYAEIISSKTGVAERVQREFNVMIAGPSTVTALLNSLALGFRAVAINEKANEVRLLLAAARQQYDKFGDLIEKARRKIDEAGKSLDEADRRNTIIRKKLGKAGEIDAGASDEILGTINNDIQEENS